MYVLRTLGDRIFLDAVMDGVTRRQGGEASRALAAALAAAPLQSAEDIVAVLEEVNQQFHQLGCGRFWLTTVAAALYVGGVLSVVSVGDSPIMLVRSESSHWFCSGLRGVYVGANRHLVHLYRAHAVLRPGDRVLLASDGVTDGVDSGALVDILRQAVTPEEATTGIRALLHARQAGGRASAPSGGYGQGDDWTAIVRFFGKPDEPPECIGGTVEHGDRQPPDGRH